MGSGIISSKIYVNAESLGEEIEKFMHQGFNHLITITAVDRKTYIELIYHLSNLQGKVQHLSVRISKGKNQ